MPWNGVSPRGEACSHLTRGKGPHPLIPASDRRRNRHADLYADLDDAIMEMIDYDGPVIFDCLVEKHENCFPMIPSGEPHNKMLLGEAPTKDAIGASGAVLV